MQPEEDDQIAELEKLVEENQRAFERAKRLLEDAKKRARQNTPTGTPGSNDVRAQG